MPVNIQRNRLQIDSFRESRKRTEAQLLANLNKIKTLEKEQYNKRREGANSAEIAALSARIKSEKKQRVLIQDKVLGLDSHIKDIIDKTINKLTLESTFEQLEGTTPIALFPVRLETRFSKVARKNFLKVRVYPDQVHIDAHVPALLPQEVEAGKDYWKIRNSNDKEKTQAAWSELCTQFNAGRAVWIVRSLVPTNLGSPHLDFPDPEIRLDSSGDIPKAKLLPDRWVVIGYKHRPHHEPTEIFRKWGSTIPDSLNLTVSFDEQAKEVEDKDSLPIDQGMVWSVDYDEAERVGMAITLSDDDVAGRRTLMAGVDLLMVFGVDWTLNAEQGSELISQQFDAHQYSDGMAFVPQGTPSNNTDAVRSGFNSNPLSTAKSNDPIVQAASLEQDNAASRLVQGLGLNEQTESITLLQNAGIQEQAINSHMIDALWESTMGYYLDELIDPLATDKMVDLARNHATKFLQPFGPFSAIRIGKQPYGIIPTMAPSLFKASDKTGTEKIIAKILKVLHWYWHHGISNVPYLGKSNNPDDDLLALLQHVPVSVAKRYRRVIDTELAANIEGLKDYSKIQVDLLQYLLFDQFHSSANLSFKTSKIAQIATFPTSYPHYAPWVQSGELEADTPLSPNYINTLVKRLMEGSKGRSKIRNQTSSKFLLEALLAHAALRELDHSSIRLIDKFLLDSGTIKKIFRKSSFQIQPLTGIYKEREKPNTGQFFIQTPEQVAKLIVPSITGNRKTNMADFISKEMIQGLKNIQAFYNLGSFSSSISALSHYSAKEIDRSFRGVVDCYSYRLDAWYTSLASRRLDSLRKTKPQGLHIGAYGWVENLKPKSTKQPSSLGYIHTPSIAHASTAAILRSGHLSHRGYNNSNKTVAEGTEASALNIDLSSERVRIALSTLEAVAQGQSLATILGYRFERMLQERDHRLAKYILQIRKLAPYKLTSSDSDSNTTEDIASREVVDGVKLLELWRKNPTNLLNRVKADNTRHKNKIHEVLKNLDDMLDAISDVLVSESVYQTVKGNYERAGAALASLDRQTRPPDPEFVRTPRSQYAYQQRVLLLLQKTDLPTSWHGITKDSRALTEPRLNAWAAEIIGDPQQYEIVANVLENDKVVEIHTVSLLQLLKDMQVSPLSIVLMSVSTNQQAPSELELACARYFANQVSNPKPGMSLELVAASTHADGSKIGFAALQSLLEMMNKAIVKPKVAGAHDLIVRQGEVSPNFDIADLESRFNAVFGTFNLIRESLTKAIENPGSNPAMLSDALIKAFQFGVADAQPDVVDTDPDAETVLAEQAISIRNQLKAKHLAILEAENDFDKTAETDNRKIANYLMQQISHIFGEAFPLLPLFELHNQHELSLSLNEQNALKQNDDFACLTWLQQMAQVHPQIEKQVSVLTGSELLGNTHINEHLRVMQLPYKKDQAWAGITLPSEPEDLLLALVTIGDYQLDKPIAGIVCDGWNEAIPTRKETTAISFHYDAPASRAPQSIILAVPPSTQQKTWTFDAVVKTLLHTHELAKIRAVGPKEIPVLGGGMLPMIYFTSDKSKQRPSIDLDHMSNFWKSKVNKIRGKMNSHAYKK